MPVEAGMLTSLLTSLRGGDARALEEIFQIVLPELHRHARHLLVSERQHHTLQPTALVNEAFLRLFDGTPASWENSRHFLQSAYGEMRRVLVDHARRVDAQKRGRKETVELSEQAEAAAPRVMDPSFLIDLGRALEELAQTSERAVRIAEMTIFGELNSEEIGAVLGVSYRTVEREWRWTRAWLRRYLHSLTATHDT